MTDVNRPSVLISGTDSNLFTLIDYILQSNGFLTHSAEDVEQTLQVALKHSPDLILLDEKVPPCGSVAACERLRQGKATRRIPVLTMVNDDELENGLVSATDAYVTKPISPPDLLDGLRRTLEMSRAETDDDILRTGDIELNGKTYRVCRDGRPVHLAPIEFRLLRHLMQHPEEVFTRDELASVAWRPGIYVGPRTVDVHIGRLRKTLKQPSKPDPIRTVRSVGYALVE